MTPASRVFRAIAREDVDHLPFCTYNCHPFAWGSHAADPGYSPILAAIRSTGAAMLCKVSAERVGDGEPVSAEQARDGDTLVSTTTLRTPRGPLVRVTRKPPDQPPMCVRHFVQDDADIERYLSLGPRKAQWRVDRLLVALRDVGESGVAYLDYGDPFYAVSELFDQEEFMVRCITDPRVGDLVRFEHVRQREALRSLLELLDGLRREQAVPGPWPLLFYTVGPERATPPLLPPSSFEELVVPFQQELVALIHEHGHPVSLHCHGRVRQVLPGILSCAFDVLEPAEPPPQGDICLSELLERCGGRMAIMGYLQDQELHTLSEEEVRSRIREIAETVGRRSGYVCSPTCTPFQHPPRQVYVRNYVAWLQEAAQRF